MLLIYKYSAAIIMAAMASVAFYKNSETEAKHTALISLFLLKLNH